MLMAILGVGEASANVVLVGIAQENLVAILQGSRVSDLDKCLGLERKHARKSEKEKNLFHVIPFFWQPVAGSRSPIIFQHPVSGGLFSYPRAGRSPARGEASRAKACRREE